MRIVIRAGSMAEMKHTTKSGGSKQQPCSPGPGKAEHLDILMGREPGLVL